MEKIKANEKGISIIALILIIMLLIGILALGVWAVLNGKFFDFVEERSYKLQIEQIKVALETKIQELNSDNNEEEIKTYELQLSDLDMSSTLKIEFRDKLIISKTGELLYNPQTVKKEWEQKELNKLGVKKIYSFTLNQVKEPGIYIGNDNGTIMYNAEKFWKAIGADLSGQYGVNFENETLIGKMSSNSSKLPFVTEYKPKEKGDIAFSFGEKNIEGTNYVLFQIGYFDGKKSVKNHFSYEEMLEKYGDIEIYFWSK